VFGILLEKNAEHGTVFLLEFDLRCCFCRFRRPGGIKGDVKGVEFRRFFFHGQTEYRGCPFVNQFTAQHVDDIVFIVFLKVEIIKS
jgi:hypothetical protein